MANSCKYYKQRREMSYDGVTWIPLDEYRKGDLVPGASSDCSSPTPTLYRWVQTEDTVCVENANSTYTKYYVYKKQQQVNGQWVDVSPAVTKPDGNPLGTYETLAECQGYVPPTPTGTTKFRATYTGGTTYEIECDSNTTLTSGDTQPAGYSKYAMTDAAIGDCVTKIGYGSFSGFTSISSVTIPNSVTSIDNAAFCKCSGLTSVVIPNSVTTIGAAAFDYCSGLTSVTIGSNVTSIGQYTFRYCTGLTSVTIPNSVTNIDQAVFLGCASLTSVVIPSSITSIEYLVFGDCSGLTSVTIPSTVTSIGASAFGNCYGITSITIPSSVTTIGNFSFGSCRGLSSINIPNSVTLIGDSAFRWCWGLTSTTIGDGIETIGDYAFQNCTGLTTVTCSATTPPTLGTGAFDYTNNCPIYVPSQSVNSYKSSWSMYSDRIVALP